MNSSANVDGSSPDLSGVFRWAVVRVATYAEHPSTAPRLLFGSVSLLEVERPQPESAHGVDQFKVGKGRSGRLFVRRIVMSAAAAIDWYRGASATMRTPVPSDQSEIAPDLDGQEILASDFFDDPAWPKLGVPSGPDLLSGAGGAGDPAPFIGSAAAPARIHRRFGDTLGFDAVTKDAEAIRFLKRRLHVDLADYAEYIGSLVLVSPNPILRGVAHHLVPSEGGGPEKLMFRMMPRLGQKLDDLKLTVLERRANLLSRFEEYPVPEDGLIEIQQQQPVETSGYAVTHPKYGVLIYQAPVGFVRRIHIQMGIVGRKVKVEAPKSDSPNSASARYVVSEIGHERPIEVGDPPLEKNLSRVFAAESRRERRAQARRYDQTWFKDGDRDSALKFIRTRIGRAREKVLVADPYFSGNQLVQFLHAVPRTDVQLTILTSRLAFEAERPPDKIETATGSDELEGAMSPKAKAEQSLLKQFSVAMETFKQRGIENASALVLTGRVPRLHDRFLVVDGNVWFLGNSLNALGDRASLILQVPDPEPVLERLLDMSLTALSFDDYLKRRSRPTRPQKRGGK